jgi:hypothetical protein
MARLEAKAAEQVAEACVRTESVKKCVFTSSLLACVWRQNYPHDRRFPTTIDENCWSEESFCRDNKASIYLEYSKMDCNSIASICIGTRKQQIILKLWGRLNILQLWFALGKTMAEKAAWRAARGTDLKLVTMCPHL